MMESKYQKIAPEGMFIVSVERRVKQDMKSCTFYELTYKVELRPTGNDFINLFAALIRSHSRRPASAYAAMMGVEVRQLEAALMALTGVGFLGWMDAFSGAVAEGLLHGTDWKTKQIAKAVGFSSDSVFCRWFRKKYKCLPRELQWK
ncbi:MAG: AraC family transcriptional regulator [Tannerellaceae bacterium]|nr:AraC family transcriptional regulator [Tannerellaceae bacterium]